MNCFCLTIIVIAMKITIPYLDVKVSNFEIKVLI